MSKITRNLMIYFTTILIVFALLMTFSFTRLYSRNIVSTNKEIIMSNADQIALNLADYLEQGTKRKSHMGMSHMGRQSELNSFVKIVDQISYGEVWLIDKDKTIITNSMHSSDELSEEISEEGIRLIEEALEGYRGYSESFKRDQRSMAVSVPAVNDNGEIVAAVLVLAPINGTQVAVVDGLKTLALSGLIALGLTLVIAIILSRRFVKPITKIHETTRLIADEDYDVKTNINQDDEIGELAQSIDVLSKRLAHAKKQRERYDQERKDFYIDISHELRTPVTVLKGSLELLVDKKVEEKDIVEYHQLMLVEVTYLQHMINDLLDYSKLNNKDVELVMEPLNISDILSDAIRGMRRVADFKEVKILYEDNVSGIPFIGNYEKIRQMFVIVLDNGIKYSDNNSMIHVSSEEYAEFYRISIQDHGEGIAKEDLPYIFDRYYKDESMNGTGIGLALSKEIAKRHNIKIAVDSDEFGTTFTFEFNKD